MTIKQMVRRALEKYELARSSDDCLYDTIIMMFGYSCVPHWKFVQFVNAMTRERRRIQMTGQLLGRKEVQERRQKNSKYRKGEYKANKKDIENIALLKK